MSEQNPNIVAMALQIVPKLGAVTVRQKLAEQGSLAEVWQGLEIDATQKDAFIESAKQQYELYQKQDIQVLSIGQDDYPSSLLAVKDAPIVVFTKGLKELLNQPMVAVVGSRNANDYGSEITQMLVSQLVAQGWVIASGMAQGIDSIAHQTTVASGGQTVAVLGYSFDSLGSQANQSLVKRITQNGLFVSQFNTDTQPQKFTFPIRNRLLAALSQAVIVTQATKHSGSLLTAQAAIDYNKPVLAVPGSLFNPGSQGTHQLIQQGARLVVDAADIVKTLGAIATAPAVAPTSPVALSLPANQQRLLDLLSNGPLPTDHLIRSSHLPAAEVLSMLSLLEMQGLVRNAAGEYRVI